MKCGSPTNQAVAILGAGQSFKKAIGSTDIYHRLEYGDVDRLICISLRTRH